MTELLERLLVGENLDFDEAGELLITLCDENLPAAAAGAILATLRAKGETPEEVRGLAAAMRRVARRPTLPKNSSAVDIVGTGGDGSGSLNLSTGSALLAAACGSQVVKHGNRSISSRSGSADVLEALGVTLPANERQVMRCLESTGFTFVYAPYFHPAMKALASVRRDLAIRTVFNILGPLTNPAEPPFCVIGAFSLKATSLMADALTGFPIKRAFVIHGAAGWDEPTPIGPFKLFDVTPNKVRRSVRDPLAYGIAQCSTDDLAGGAVEDNAKRLRSALSGERGPHRDALVLGAALALEVTEACESFEEAIDTANQAIDNGSADALITQLAGIELGE